MAPWHVSVDTTVDVVRSHVALPPGQAVTRKAATRVAGEARAPRLDFGRPCVGFRCQSLMNVTSKGGVHRCISALQALVPRTFFDPRAGLGRSRAGIALQSGAVPVTAHTMPATEPVVEVALSLLFPERRREVDAQLLTRTFRGQHLPPPCLGGWCLPAPQETAAYLEMSRLINLVPSCMLVLLGAVVGP